jgi:hypothetical protein
MLTKTVLDAQTTIELPAREMLFFNWNTAYVGANQQAANNSAQLNVIGALQLNLSGQANGQAQGVSVNQS